MSWPVVATMLVLLGLLAIVAMLLEPDAAQAQSRNRGIVILVVGIAMAAFGVATMALGWDEGTYTMPIIGIVFIAIGARQIRTGANQ